MKQICRAIFEEICVLANGEVVCSCGDPAGLRVYGNVLDEPIETIFNSPLYREMRAYQLESKPSNFCPIHGRGCAGRVYAATPLHTEAGLHIKRLQLEPISKCNLDCPACPVHNFDLDTNYRRNRKALLSLADMIHVVEQLPHLELIWFYNFGEPFLHPDAIDFLQYMRREKPQVEVHASTNGIPLTAKKATAIAEGRLLRNVLFSIDGSDQNSYEPYRKNGRFEIAFQNMVFLQNEVIRCRAEKEVQLIWQYILFEWNDSDEAIERAKRLASEHGLTIKWVLTHTRGRSKRFTHKSEAYAQLIGPTGNYENLTCELQAQDLFSNGVKDRIYRADLAVLNQHITADALSLELEVVNTSNQRWELDPERPLRLGIRLLNAEGDFLFELNGLTLPHAVEKGASIQLQYHTQVDLPAEGKILLIDMVHDQVCWFHERGSAPFILSLAAEEGARSELIATVASK